MKRSLKARTILETEWEILTVTHMAIAKVAADKFWRADN